MGNVFTQEHAKALEQWLKDGGKASVFAKRHKLGIMDVYKASGIKFLLAEINYRHGDLPMLNTSNHKKYGTPQLLDIAERLDAKTLTLNELKLELGVSYQRALQIGKQAHREARNLELYRRHGLQCHETWCVNRAAMLEE